MKKKISKEGQLNPQKNKIMTDLIEAILSKQNYKATLLTKAIINNNIANRVKTANETQQLFKK